LLDDDVQFALSGPNEQAANRSTGGADFSRGYAGVGDD